MQLSKETKLDRKNNDPAPLQKRLDQVLLRRYNTDFGSLHVAFERSKKRGDYVQHALFRLLEFFNIPHGEDFDILEADDDEPLLLKSVPNLKKLDL